MVEVTKSEVNFLEGKGCRWHEEIFSTVNRRHYYAVEIPWVINCLQKYRKEVTS